MAEHQSYIESKRDEWLVFLGDGQTNMGEILFKPYTHRWTQGYTKRQYARLHDFVRGAREEYDDPHIVMLPALTASTTDAVGNPRPPLDHFDQIKESWKRGVRYELAHSMNADREKDEYVPREWEYLQIWEPTTDAGGVAGGYAHQHTVVVCDGPVEEERFASVVNKHVRKCRWAEASAHDYTKTDVRPLDSFANPAAYLFKYLGKSWVAGDGEPFQDRFDALLFETGYRRFQPSQGAQRWMQREVTESPEEWLFAGVGDGEQVEVLREYEGAEAFKIAREQGVRSYLADRDASEMQPKLLADAEESAVEGCDHPEWHRGCCLGCGVSERALVAGVVGGG